MHDIGPCGRVTNSVEAAALEAALLAPIQLGRRTFDCPDCAGDPACPTCGEPSRPGVLAWLQRELAAVLG